MPDNPDAERGLNLLRQCCSALLNATYGPRGRFEIETAVAYLESTVAMLCADGILDINVIERVSDQICATIDKEPQAHD